MSVTIRGTDTSAAAPSFTGTDGDTGMFFPAADTIAFAEGGAEVARFNSSGNLGIGNSNPTFAKLVVIGSGTSASIMTNTAAAFNGGANAFNIGDDGTDVLIGPGNSGSKLTLLSRAGGVYSRALTVDSAGQVTTPLQPMFNARNDSGQVLSNSTINAVITFTSVNNNIGSHYNPSNSRFTAPVAGNYYFACNIVFDALLSVRVCEFAIRVNGSTDFAVCGFASSNFTGSNEHPGMSVSAVIYMNAGDFCTINQRSHVDIDGTINVRGGANGFSGYLLG